MPEQAKSLSTSEGKVVHDVLLGETGDGEFTTMDDVAQTALLWTGRRRDLTRSGDRP